MSVVLGRVILVLILIYGICILIYPPRGPLNIPFNSRVEKKLEQTIKIDFPSEFTVNCVVSCFPILSRTRHAIELHFEDKDFQLLIKNWNINISSGIIDVWNGCDRASGTLLSAFVEVEKRRFFYDHGTLTKGDRC